MKIILPRLIVIVTLYPVLMYAWGLLSYLIFKELNFLFVITLATISYIHGICSYSIFIKNGVVSAKERVFQMKRKKIKITEIIRYKEEKVRSGEVYFHLIGNRKMVTIFRTYFSKKQITDLKYYIKEYKISDQKKLE